MSKTFLDQIIMAKKTIAWFSGLMVLQQLYFNRYLRVYTFGDDGKSSN